MGPTAEPPLHVVAGTHSDGLVPLGSECRFDVHGLTPDTEVRPFLAQQNVVNLRPLGEWAVSHRLLLRPESPGHYVLALVWRRKNGAHGRIDHPFEVVLDTPLRDGPCLVRLDDATEMWAPSEWEGGLLRGSEQSVFDRLTTIVKPGWVIYDIGASLGLYSVRLARAVGASGHVYSIEASPLALYFLRSNVELNHIANCSILPVALSNDTGRCGFVVNYGNVNLGLTERSPWCGSKLGHELWVEASPLDSMTEKLALRPPNLLKVDVEGAEQFVLSGALDTIRQSLPTLLVEVHGRAAAEGTFEVLGRLPYRYAEASAGTTFVRATEMARSFPDAVRQVLAVPLVDGA